MDKKIDFEKILNIVEPNGELLSTELAIECMKKCVRQALPIILQMAADRAEAESSWDGESGIVDKQSILNREEEIIKKLGL